VPVLLHGLCRFYCRGSAASASGRVRTHAGPPLLAALASLRTQALWTQALSPRRPQPHRLGWRTVAHGAGPKLIENARRTGL